MIYNVNLLECFFKKIVLRIKHRVLYLLDKYSTTGVTATGWSILMGQDPVTYNGLKFMY